MVGVLSAKAKVVLKILVPYSIIDLYAFHMYMLKYFQCSLRRAAEYDCRVCSSSRLVTT